MYVQWKVSIPTSDELFIFRSGQRARACRHLDGFAYLCDATGRTSPREGRRAGPPPMLSRQTDMVAEEASEKVEKRVAKRASKRG